MPVQLSRKRTERANKRRLLDERTGRDRYGGRPDGEGGRPSRANARHTASSSLPPCYLLQVLVRPLAMAAGVVAPMSLPALILHRVALSSSNGL